MVEEPTALDVGVADVVTGADDGTEEEECDDDDTEEVAFEVLLVGSGEKDSDTLGLATLQNCCEIFSAEARSPKHWD